jgi:hypothetical protein
MFLAITAVIVWNVQHQTAIGVIDDYLFARYEKTPKIDTTGDFSEKDILAAQKAGMSVQAYVIGCMDQSFKRQLYALFRAAQDAGLEPGITAGYRGPFRQSITSGTNKNRPGRSWHGGLNRGCGYGVAADVVSIKGSTRDERLENSRRLWRWIDAHPQYGIGRPYGDRDAPHVASIDGQEYRCKKLKEKAACPVF